MTELQRYVFVYMGVPLGLGLTLWTLAALGWRRFGRRLAPLWLLGAPLVGGGAMVAQVLLRAPPPPVERDLFPGITYARKVRATPVPLVWHEVRIDLAQPGLSLTVTPHEPGGERQIGARTTTRFVEEFGVQLAVNASYFFPQRSNSLLSNYPDPGERVTVVGPTVSAEVPYDPPSPFDDRTTSLHWWPGRATITATVTGAPEVVSGFPLLTDGVLEGDPVVHPNRRHPRVAVGLEPGGRVMWWVVAEGRQPRYSEGTDVAETAALLRDKGIRTALLLDGGGSATLAMEGAHGEPTLLNTPVHGRLPAGVQRPVANHLGVRVR